MDIGTREQLVMRLAQLEERVRELKAAEARAQLVAGSTAATPAAEEAPKGARRRRNPVRKPIVKIVALPAKTSADTRVDDMQIDPPPPSASLPAVGTAAKGKARAALLPTVPRGTSAQTEQDEADVQQLLEPSPAVISTATTPPAEVRIGEAIDALGRQTEQMTAGIASLTQAIVELAATNARLSAQLEPMIQREGT